MASGTEWPSATIQYRLNLPNALYSISPALSALHASRAAALHPEVTTILQPSYCPRCGTYRFSGDHPTYPPKKKRRKRSTPPLSSLLRCRLCGFSIDTIACSSSPNDPSVPVQLPSNPSRMGTVATNEMVQAASGNTFRPTTSTTILPSRSRQFHPKFHAKTSTLKDMLSRDRQREEGKKAHDKRKGGHEGLAAFLKEL